MNKQPTDDYQDAWAVYLAGCRCLYATGARSDEEVDELNYPYAATQRLRITLQHDLVEGLAKMFDLGFHGLGDKLWEFATKECLDESDGVAAVTVTNWKGIAVEKIVALEHGEGLWLFVTHRGGWVERISYRGEYSVQWQDDETGLVAP